VTQSAAERRYVRLAGSINAKAARLGRAGRVSAADLAAIFVASGWKCAYCQIGIDPMHCSFDHVIAFDRGGPNDPTNIRACCLSCQRSKSTKSPEEYDQARKLMVECEVCGKPFKPRWADWVRGFGRTCSRVCSGKKGGQTESPASSPA
jgi:hypothetical protein